MIVIEAGALAIIHAVKHGYVERVSDWSLTTFHGMVERCIYRLGWCSDISVGESR